MQLPQHQARALAPLLSRRSVSALVGPAPTDPEIDAILQAAVTVPDHGGLRPWRLVVVAGGARSAFGDALAAAAHERLPDLSDASRQRIRAKALAAPALITVVARVDQQTRVPRWEQIASAACVGYAITLAAHQLGLGAMWRSIPFVTGAQLRTVLDMGPEDEFLGWVNIGHVASDEHAATRPGIDLTPIELGLTILLITHEVRVARRLADTTAVMRAGRIVEVGRTASVLTTPRDPYTRALLDAVLPAQPRQVSVQQ